jgi:hypothetical protein
MNNLAAYYFLLLLNFTFVGCAKKDFKLTQNGDGPVTNFRSELGGSRAETYDKFFQDTHGVLSFKVTRQYPNLSSFSVQTSGYFCENLWASYTTENRVYKNVGTVKIGTVTLPMEERKGYIILNHTDEVKNKVKNLLGTTVKYKIDGLSGSGYGATSEDLYIPKPMNPVFANNNFTLGNRFAVSRNGYLNITWEADEQNDKGIVLIIENGYPVDTLGNPNMSTNIRYAYNVVLLEDDGNYTFSTSDFTSIPNNQELILTMMRANITIVENGSKKIKLYGGEEIFNAQYVLVQ